MEDSEVGFLGNLNVFIPAWALLSMSLGWLVTLLFMAPIALFSMIFGPVGDSPAASLLAISLPTLAGPVIFGVFLAWRWAKRGLIPGPILRRGRYDVGQALLAACNLLGPGGMLALVVYQRFFYSGPADAAGALGFLLIPAWLVGILCAVVGLVLIWTSRTAGGSRSS